MFRIFNDPVLILHSQHNFFVAATSNCIKVLPTHISLFWTLLFISLISPGETCWHNSRSVLSGKRSLLSHPDLSRKSKPLWNWNHSLFTFPPRSWGHNRLAGCQGIYFKLFLTEITLACSDVEARQWSIGSTSNSRSKEANTKKYYLIWSSFSWISVEGRSRRLPPMATR